MRKGNAPKVSAALASDAHAASSKSVTRGFMTGVVGALDSARGEQGRALVATAAEGWLPGLG